MMKLSKDNPITLGQILPLFDPISHVHLWQTDAYTDMHEDEEIFTGSLSDIPWMYIDYYFTYNKDDDYYPIDCRLDNDHRPSLIICVCEDKENIGK